MRQIDEEWGEELFIEKEELGKKLRESNLVIVSKEGEERRVVENPSNKQALFGLLLKQLVYLSEKYG